jgi:hypothetical protein
MNYWLTVSHIFPKNATMTAGSMSLGPTILSTIHDPISTSSYPAYRVSLNVIVVMFSGACYIVIDGFMGTLRARS